MFEFLQELELPLRIFWYLAMGSSLFFIIQTIFTFTGVDSSDGTAADFDSDLSGGDRTFQLFSLRNLVNFILGFSWAGVVFYPVFNNKALVYTIAVIIGLLFVLIFFFIMQQVFKLSENNTFSIQDTINQTGEVYLTIPANRNGKGKVQISIRGSFHELDAITDNESITTGTLIRVEKVENNTILVVKKI